MNDLEMLKSQLAEARTQANDWKTKYERLESGQVPNVRVHVFYDQLKTYGRHLESCSGQDKCDCGFYEVMIEAKELIGDEDPTEAEGTA